MSNKKRLFIGLSLCCLLAVPVICNTNVSRIMGTTGGYTCYLPEGATEIRDIVRSGIDGHTYLTRGTVTRLARNNDGTITTAFIQRTNGDDGSKSAIKLDSSSYEGLRYIKEGNVIDVRSDFFRGVVPTLSYVYDLSLVQETNPNPVEPLEITISDLSTFQEKDFSRLVTLKNVKLVNEIFTIDGDNIGFTNNLCDATNNTLHTDLYINAMNNSATNEIINSINSHYNNNAVFNLTGILYNLAGDTVVQIMNKNDIEVVSEDETSTKEIKIYAINDFHGAVEADGSQIGLEMMGTYLKKKGIEANTLTIDSGDTWQGSIYSNYNHGQMINDVMNYAHVSARTIGNHDFDWSVDQIKANTAASYAGYSTPVLAANVYDYNFDTKVVGTTQQSDIGRESVTYVLDNGLKVGIVGVIGCDQMTSITSSFTTNIAFINEIDVLKQQATALRSSGCDIVIGSIHAGQSSVKYYGLEEYFDLMLCGHTHSRESSYEGDLRYIQCGNNGNCVGEITLTYDTETESVTYTDLNYVDKYDIASEYENPDSNVTSIMNRYTQECQAEADVVVANNVYGTFSSKTYLADLMCKAIFDQACLEGYDIDLSYCNSARTTLTTSTWTYADLYEAFPFDNIVYIMDITGSEILNEVKKYNNIYRNPEFTEQIDPNGIYTIACLDYLAMHTNSNRDYDYFPFGAHHITGSLSKNYRLILRDWLHANGYDNGEELDYFDYADYQWNYDRDSLIGPQYTITLDYNINDLGTYGTFNINVGDNLQYFNGYTLYLEGYYFCGWYYDSACQYPVNYNDVPTESITLYAKWTENEPAPDGLSTGNLDYTYFYVGSIETTVYAGEQQIEILHSSIGDKSSYSQFGISNYGYMQIVAPSGYKIYKFEMKVYNTYDNFNFYAADMNDSGDALDENTSYGSKDLTYNVYPDSQYLYMPSSYSGSISIYYINITLVEA